MSEINLKPEKLVRVHIDIPFESAQKIKMRIATRSMESGRHVTRNQYLAELIEQDVAKVKGAALRTITTRANKEK